MKKHFRPTGSTAILIIISIIGFIIPFLIDDKPHRIVFFIFGPIIFIFGFYMLLFTGITFYNDNVKIKLNLYLEEKPNSYTLFKPIFLEYKNINRIDYGDFKYKGTRISLVRIELKYNNKPLMVNIQIYGRKKRKKIIELFNSICIKDI